MSEPSILDYASTQGLDEVMSSAGQKVQTLISAATEQARALSQRRAERGREVAERGEAARRQLKERRDALYEADHLVWSRVWDDRFWERATPERVARAWEACTPWAMEGWPSARATIEHMRGEIKDRFGVEVDPVEVGGTDLVSLLGAGPDGRTDTPGTGPEPAETGRLASISYRIRDTRNGGVVAETGVVHLASDDGPGVVRQIAAERLADHQRRHGSAEHGFTIEVFSGDRPGEGALLHSMDAGTAGRIRDRYHAIVSQGRQADARAKQTDAGSAEVADVLRLERRRLRERLTSLTNSEASADGSEHRAQAGESSAAIRDRLVRVGTRLQAAEADLRGENGDVVVWWAALRQELDEQWWRTATETEAAGVWGQVADWPQGQARDRALDHLRTAFHREYEVVLSRDASQRQVREAIGEKTQRQDTRTNPPDDARDDAHGAAEELWRRSRPEDAEERRAHDAGDRMGENDPDTSTAHAEHDWARAQRDAANQDRAAAGAYENLAGGGQAEAADAGSTVARAYPASPSARLARTAPAGHTRGRGATPAPAPARTEADRTETGR